MRIFVLLASMLLVVACGGSEEPQTTADTTSTRPYVPATGMVPATVRAAQTEAKMLLQQLHTLEQAYYAETGSYAAPAGDLAAGGRFDQIGFEVPRSARYVFSIRVSASGFTATAKANLDPDPAQDVWRVDQTGTLTCVSNDAAR